MSCSSRFNKINRLTCPAEFQPVFKSSLRSRDDLLLVLASKNNLEIARLGLAVPKKRVRTAVERNKIKRVIRESFRKNQHMLSGLDIVVVSQNSIKQGPNQGLTNSLLAHWQRIVNCKNM